MTEAVQEGDVHKEPDDPPREAAQPNPVKLYDGVEPTQGRRAADVAILEREVTGVAVQPTANRVGGMEAALHRNLAHSRKIVDRGHVADGEDLGMTRQGHVGQHGYSA